MQADYAMQPAPRPLWKNRDYVLLWCGQTVSIIGTQVSSIAFPLLVLALTDSPIQAGLVAASRTLPYLLFTLPAGALVDRWNRKAVMIACNVGSGLALASVAVSLLLGVTTVAQIAIVSFVEGTFSVFFSLAEAGALPQVVTKEQLGTAVAQNQIQYSIGGIIGPPLGGTLYSAAHLLPFAADAGSYAVSGLSLVAVKSRLQSARDTVLRSLRAEIGEGLAWLWHHPLIRYMAFLTGGINIGTTGYVLVIVVLAKEQGASPALTGAIFAVGGVVGALGAGIGAFIQRRFSFSQAIIGTTWYFALSYALYAVAGTPALLFGIVAFSLLFGPTYDIVQYTYRIAIIPDALQGRVNSVFRLISWGVRPLGFALIGVLLERAGG
ncbi:MAG: MFS transporter, partial [Chloroflexota bacterium]|nr:MFS transporter [Chloroflexota bacterium]